MLDDSRSRAGRNVIGLLARANSELDDLANEIYRCPAAVTSRPETFSLISPAMSMAATM